MRNTKRRMTVSLLALLVCCVMLAGTTFAWFTDTASNIGNRIQAGELDVDLLKYVDINGDGIEVKDYVSIADREVDPENPPTGGIFNAGDGENIGNGVNWEPGKTEIVYLAVRNLGSLALKYNIKLDVTIPAPVDDEPATNPNFASQFEYAIIDGAQPANLAAAASWTDITNSVGVLHGDVSLGTFVAAQNGCLDEIANGEENETDYFALAIHMKETAGNEYMNGEINFDVTVDATQMTAEFDSFSNQYDEAAVLKTATVVVEEAPTAPVTVEAAPQTAVEIPLAAALDAGNTVTFSVKGGSEPAVGVTVAATQESQSFEIALLVDGEPAPELDADDPDAYYTVTLNVGKGLDDVKVYHKGLPVDATLVTYDRDTGELTIKTKSFSPFDIVFEKPVPVEVDEETDFANLLTGKTYKLVDNVTLTNTLTITKEITLDLNGKTLTLASLNGGSQIFGSKITATGGLTVNDTVGGGKITTTGQAAVTSGDNTYNNYPMINCNGKFTLNSGTVESAGYVYVVFSPVGSSCVVTINGGSLLGKCNDDCKYKGASFGAVAISANGMIGNAGYKLTVNGGTVSGSDSGMYLPSAGETVINGGTISGRLYAVVLYSGNLNVAGGTISASAERYDGEFTTDGNSSGPYTGAIVAVKPKSSTPGAGYNGDIVLNISGGTISNTNGDAIFAGVEPNGSHSFGVSVTKTGGTIVGTIAADANVTKTGLGDVEEVTLNQQH